MRVAADTGVGRVGGHHRERKRHDVDVDERADAAHRRHHTDAATASADVRAMLSRRRAGMHGARPSRQLMDEVRLPLDWELWVVEHLLFTAHMDELASALAERGVDRTDAVEQIERIVASTGFARLRARLSEATFASRLERLQRALLPPMEAIAVREDIDADTLHRGHWVASRPVKLTACAPRMKALGWSLASFAERFGDAEIGVNVDRGAAKTSRDVERVEAPMTMRAFVDRALGPATDELYVVSRNGLLGLPALAPLWDELAPLPSFLAPPRRPRGVSLWAGPKGTLTRPHFDPHNVLLFQIEGEKRVRLSPRPAAEHAARFDGYYLAAPLDPSVHTIFETVLRPGEALFVPAAWIHEVTALAPSLTLSFLTFPWPNHFHFLGPPASDVDGDPSDIRLDAGG